jgi:hypothetical protein
MSAAVRTTAPTGSSEAGSGTWSTGPLGGGAFRLAATAGFRLAAPAGFGPAAPAAFAPGFALVRAAFGERVGFAAGLLAASAFAAALAAVFAGVPADARLDAAPARFPAAARGFAAPESRFALRFPGRELGRFPSTPPSSVMDGDSSSARSGYTEAEVADDKVTRGINWLTG